MKMTNIKTINIRYHDEKRTLGLFEQKLSAEDSFVGSLEFVDRFNKKYGVHTHLIDPELADYVLNHTNAESIVDYSPFMVNAVIGYEGRVDGSFKSKPLGVEISFYQGDRTVIFPTKNYADREDTALFVKGLDLERVVIDGKNIKLEFPAKDIVATPFPSSNGWYSLDGEKSIPYITECDGAKESARFIIRRQKPQHHSGSLAWDPVIPFSGEYVGPIYRCAPKENAELASRAFKAEPTATEGIVIEISDRDLKMLKMSKFERDVRAWFMKW